MVASFVSLGLHLSHTEFIGIARSTRLLILDINDVIIYLVHKPFNLLLVSCHFLIEFEEAF